MSWSWRGVKPSGAEVVITRVQASGIANCWDLHGDFLYMAHFFPNYTRRLTSFGHLYCRGCSGLIDFVTVARSSILSASLPGEIWWVGDLQRLAHMLSPPKIISFIIPWIKWNMINLPRLFSWIACKIPVIKCLLGICRIHRRVWGTEGMKHCIYVCIVYTINTFRKYMMVHIVLYKWPYSTPENFYYFF